jgi:hypothetical protein
VGRQLLASASAPAALIPLIFQRAAQRILKYRSILEKEITADIADRAKQYRDTAQVVEGVTRFLPALISQIVSVRSKRSSACYFTMQHMVRNTYWCLRIYQNVDLMDTIFTLSDINRLGKVSAIDDLLGLAKLREIPQPAVRIALRRRFVHGRILRARGTLRIRSD